MDFPRDPQTRSFACLFFVVLLILLVLPVSLHAQGAPATVSARYDTLPPAGWNLDFEEDSLGDGRRGWFTPAKQFVPDYEATLTKAAPYHGAQCVRLSSTGTPNGREFGNVMQTFNAVPFRGKTMRFRAAVRTDGSRTARAQMWFRVDRAKRRMGFFENMDAKPITSDEWGVYEIIGRIDDDAELINIGCMLIGTGSIFFDDVHFEEVPSSGIVVAPEKPKPLTNRGLENLTAFTKLYGYVRFFHPTDDVAKANWNNVAINGVRAIESASDPKMLAEELQAFFGHVAPLLRVFPTGSPITIPPELLAPTVPPSKPTAWLHDGVGLDGAHNIYSSTRVSEDGAMPGRTIVSGAYGGLAQIVPAESIRGKRVRFSVFARIGPLATSAPIELGFCIAKNGRWSDDPVERANYFPTSEWLNDTVSMLVPVDADSIKVTARIYAPASVWYDDASLMVAEGGAETNLLHNAGFEEGWKYWLGSPTDNFLEDIRGDEHHSAAKAAYSTSAVGFRDQPAFPAVAQPRTYDLGGGVSCLLPIALYETQTHIGGAGGHAAIDSLPAGFYPSGNDRVTRLADIVITWNIIKHFWPYFDVVNVDWAASLQAALRQAAVDDGDERFTNTLQRMMATLHDGHAYVSGPSNRRFAPFTTVQASGWTVVNRLSEDYHGHLRVGDIIREIDHHPVSYWYARIDSIAPAATRTAHDYLVYSNLYACLDKDSVTVSITDRDTKFHDVTEIVPYSYPRYERPVKEHITELKKGIWYVDMNEVTKEEFGAAVDKLAAADAVIVDMRGYPVHLMTIPITHMIDSTVTSARWNVPRVMYPDGERWKWDFSNWTVAPVAPRFKNIVHLTDGRAISAAETYMGIIEHYHIGEIVGDTTAGTNGNINPFGLPGRYHVSWTGMKVLKHDGSQHHGIGIRPTIVCKPTVEGIRAGRDEVLDKGIEVAQKLIKHQPVR